MKKRIKKTTLLLLFFIMAAYAAAETQVSISASDNLVFIGDKIYLKIIVKTTSGIQKLKLNPGKKEFDILEQKPHEKRNQKDFLVFEKKLVIAFFKTGDFEIGPFTVELIKDDNVIETKTTNSIPVTVKSVLKEEDKDIKPLKGLIDIKGNPFYTLKYVIAAVIVTLLVVFFILWLKKRRKAAVSRPEPLLSPLEELEARLKELAGKKLFEKGKMKLYFIELTRIFKHFLLRKYRFNAEDFTTRETMYNLKENESAGVIRDSMGFLFNTADLVKFAKFIPDPSVLAEVSDKIQDIIVFYKAQIPPDHRDNPQGAGAGQQGKKVQ